MSRPVAIALGIVVALAGTAALDLVVTGSVSVVPVGALVAAVALVVGSKALGAHVLSRPAGSRPGELGNPADDLLDGAPDGTAEGAGDGAAQASSTLSRPQREEGSGA